MNDEKLREAYARGLPHGDDRPPLDDLSAERLRRLVEREGPELERLHTIDTQLATAAGRQELEIAWAAARAARTAPTRRPWWLAAAAVLLVVGAPVLWFAREPSLVLRGAGSPITLVQPLGEAAAPQAQMFLWRALRGAERYTMVVVDSVGNEVFATETRDTAVALPDSVQLRAGMTYLWWVQARTRTGQQVTAVTERVQIRP